ncbi:uncharacterized protein PAE49_005055 isoform 2-T2 [Odontesthes bonariensis]|uniref:uncharacterized protein LOC142379749 isoform X2 n=1 Tax=Odontesthes bonariensis TaxID=219752 RepID=UPI003F58F3C0
MDASDSVPVLWYRTSKPLGKVRRRVQDLRNPSSSYSDFIASRPGLDLSHNESTRLAVDCLFNQGLEGYQRALKAEGEVDFLSEMEKNYILENARDGSTDDKDAPHVEDKEIERLSDGLQSCYRGSAVSTDSDSTVEGLDQSGPKDVKWIDPTLEDPSVEVFFQSDRAAGMKDLVRQFIRKANTALAIVMDSFSDTELLCDLLEASIKRNVSVHLLLDHHNLNLFVSMWQELKLNSKKFPKLSVRSVHGQTYCAKTGRKLTGQIAESFIISDWTEVLTGSYSFTWLSWQVHRSGAVLIKGSSVTPFHHEFRRLYSSSEPVVGFVPFITPPQALCLDSTSREAQDNHTVISQKISIQAKMISLWAWNEEAENTEMKSAKTVLCIPQNTEFDGSKGGNRSVQMAGAGSHTEREPPQLYPQTLVQPAAQCEGWSVEKPQLTVGAVGTQLVSGSNLEPLKENQNQIHSPSPRQILFSDVESQLAKPTIKKAETNLRVEEPNPMHAASPALGQHKAVCYQSALRKNSNPERIDVGSERLFPQSLVTKPLGLVSGLNTQRGQWNYSLNYQPKVGLPSDNPSLLYPSTQQPTTSHQFHFTSSRGHTSGLQTKIFNAMGTHLRLHLQADSTRFLTVGGAKMQPQNATYQQNNCPPRLNLTPQKHQAAGPRAVARYNSFSGTTATGQLGWRSPQNGMNTSLGRSRSMTDRDAAGLHPNRTYT